MGVGRPIALPCFILVLDVAPNGDVPDGLPRVGIDQNAAVFVPGIKEPVVLAVAGNALIGRMLLDPASNGIGQPFGHEPDTSVVCTQPAAPEQFRGKAVPLLSIALMAFISSSMSGTLVAVSNRARLPFIKALAVEAWSARMLGLVWMASLRLCPGREARQLDAASPAT